MALARASCDGGEPLHRPGDAARFGNTEPVVWVKSTKPCVNGRGRTSTPKVRKQTGDTRPLPDKVQGEGGCRRRVLPRGEVRHLDAQGDPARPGRHRPATCRSSRQAGGDHGDGPRTAGHPGNFTYTNVDGRTRRGNLLRVIQTRVGTTSARTRLRSAPR